MMPCTMFWSIQTFSVTGKFTERYHIFCARIDLFTIFVSSRYRPWATIRLLYHFDFVMCINSRLNCMHFSCHWRKIRNVLRRLTQISKRQRDTWTNIRNCLIVMLVRTLHLQTASPTTATIPSGDAPMYGTSGLWIPLSQARTQNGVLLNVQQMLS